MEENQGYHFKTFSGVFLPSILTIIGVVLFMRLGTIVGTLGVAGAIGILIFAESIAIATGLSISAISTNTKVESGGPYFLISRSLGTGFGSSVGLTYFISQSLAVPFYMLGFAEALAISYPALGKWTLLLSFIPLVILFAIALVGANWAIKTQYAIFTVLILSIVAIFAGGFAHDPSLAKMSENLHANGGLKVDVLVFAANFAIFFPAVTGFLAGVNMSGDLENPRKSIPFGTIAAIMVGFVLYLAVILLVGAAFSRTSLIDNAYQTLLDGAISYTSIFIILGVVAATLSSALGTLIGAPRILQAFAADKIFPVLNIFSYGRGKSREPIIAMIVTFLISVATICWGTRTAHSSGGNALDAVAGLVTMFTLSTYAIINIAAAVEDFAANPSFRPQFRLYHWTIGAYGAIASFVVALFINPSLMLVAFAIIGVIFLIARRRTLETNFGDARRGYYFEHIRRSLTRLAAMPVDKKNWRPEFLVLVGGDLKHLELIRAASLLNNDRGILSVGRLLIAQEKAAAKRHDAIRKLEEFSRENDILFFPTVVAIHDETEHDRALTILLQSRNFGPLTPNIILSGWPSRPERVAAFGSHLRVIQLLKMNHLLLLNSLSDSLTTGKTIDIWWRGRKNGELMLILAHLLSCNWILEKKSIRILRIVAPGEENTAHRELTQLVDNARIPAETVVIASRDPFPVVFRQYSRNAAVVFLGLVVPQEAETVAFYQAMDQLLDLMPKTFLVSSAGDTDIDS